MPHAGKDAAIRFVRPGATAVPAGEASARHTKDATETGRHGC